MPTRNVKIALVGGGSYTWTPKLIADLARSDYLSGSDLCLIDLNLPGLSGIELLQHVARHCPGLPAIMLTASDEVESA